MTGNWSGRQGEANGRKEPLWDSSALFDEGRVLKASAAFLVYEGFIGAGPVKLAGTMGAFRLPWPHRLF